MPFLGIYGPKIQICLFREKFATLINSNMHNSMAVFFAFVLGWKHPFWASLVQKMEIVSFS